MKMHIERRTSMSGHLVIGGLLILIGFLFLLDTMGIADTGRVVSHGWPLILIGIGINRIWTGNDGTSAMDARIGGGLWILVGSLFLLSSFRILPFSVWGLLWPSMLMAFGLYLVLRSRKARQVHVDTDARINAIAVMGGVSRRISSQQFEGGEMTAVMGGFEIDLRDAKIAGDQADLEVFVWMGGIELIIPEDWIVESRLMPIMAGVEDKTKPVKDAQKRLVIHGLLVMGGVEVKN